MVEEALSENPKKAFGPQKWSELHSQANGVLEEAAVAVTPFAGLTANALAHIRSDWIEWGDEFVKIRIPSESECNEWKLIGGGGPEKPGIVPRNQPCTYCRDQGTTNGFENLSISGLGKPDKSQHIATLHRDIASPAIEIIDRVINEWGRPGLCVSPNTLRSAARRLLPEEELGAYSKLLRTGVILYGHYGLNRSEIAELTPYTEWTIADIEGATPEVSQEMHSSYTYLRTVKNNEPISAPDLARKLEIQANPARLTLRRLKDAGRVEENKDEWPATWSAVGDWSEPFVCDTCGFGSPTLRGLSIHESSHNK